jgi:uncharacterized protein CbrC (UPF0167 family)
MNARFRYFEHPHQFSTYRQAPETCGICGNERSSYGGPFYGPGKRLDFVCEECLAGGRLAERGLSINEADLAALKKQLRERQPPLDEDTLQAVVRERATEVEQRTPHLVTWQYFVWPAHCGDYCRFVREIGVPDLNHLAPNGDGLAFFAAHTRDIKHVEHAQEVWPNIGPDSPKDSANAYDLAVYLFECLVCGQPVMLWDCW